MIIIYLLGPFTQKVVLGLNILGIHTYCIHVLPELLQIILQLINITSDSFPKNSLPIYAYIETIQLKQEITF